MDGEREGRSTGEATYVPVRTLEVPAEPRRESGAVISRQDFALLREGPPGTRFASRRDLFLGISAASLVGAIGVMATAQYFISSPPSGLNPNWWAWAFTLILLAGAGGAGTVAYFAHRDASREAGGAYSECVQSIERQFAGEKK